MKQNLLCYTVLLQGFSILFPNGTNKHKRQSHKTSNTPGQPKPGFYSPSAHPCKDIRSDTWLPFPQPSSLGSLQTRSNDILPLHSCCSNLSKKEVKLLKNNSLYPTAFLWKSSVYLLFSSRLFKHVNSFLAVHDVLWALWLMWAFSHF